MLLNSNTRRGFKRGPNRPPSDVIAVEHGQHSVVFFPRVTAFGTEHRNRSELGREGTQPCMSIVIMSEYGIRARRRPISRLVKDRISRTALLIEDRILGR